MTTYRVAVADATLLERAYWEQVDGFRLVSVDGPWLSHPGVTICTIEDDSAPADLEGKFVELEIRAAGPGMAGVIARTVIGP